MARILWYFYGDIDCLMRGLRSGTNTALADELGTLPGDGQSAVDDTGSATTPPGMAGVVADVLATLPGRDPGVPAWTAADWPLGWEVKFVEATQTGCDSVVLQPGIVAFRWPPYGGAGLGVSVASVQPVLSDPHTIRYGDLLMQTVDYLVTTGPGRAQVVAAANGGDIDNVDLVALIKKVEWQLASGPKALPASFTARIQEVRQTTKTYLDVNPAGGVHMVLGWKEVPSPSQDGPVILMKDYPCGGFVLSN